MAERPCPECGYYVSSRARACPECGAPVQEMWEEKRQERRQVEGRTGLMVFLFLLGIILSGLGGGTIVSFAVGIAVVIFGIGNRAIGNSKIAAFLAVFFCCVFIAGHPLSRGNPGLLFKQIPNIGGEVIDKLNQECTAQKSFYLKHGKMYNNSNDRKGETPNYTYGLIKYGKNDRAAPIYAKPKGSGMTPAIGVAIASPQNEFYCMICKPNLDHDVVFSQDAIVLRSDGIFECPQGYVEYQTTRL